VTYKRHTRGGRFLAQFRGAFLADADPEDYEMATEPVPLLSRSSIPPRVTTSAAITARITDELMSIKLGLVDALTVVPTHYALYGELLRMRSACDRASEATAILQFQELKAPSNEDPA
jgi:hypothetical protein